MPEEDTKCRIRLTNGYVIENCTCGYYDKTLICYIKSKISFAEAFQYFSKPEYFSVVVFDIEESAYITRTTYTGLNELVTIAQKELSLDVWLHGQEINIQTERILKESEQNNGTIHNPD